MSDEKRFTISYHPSFEGRGGVINQLSWHGTLRRMLEQAEGCAERGERIVGLVVNEQGITIYFEKEHP